MTLRTGRRATRGPACGCLDCRRWIAATGLAVGVLILGWRGAQWWRRAVSVLAVPMCVLSAALAVNLWVGYFPTVHTAWNQLTAGPLPDQTDRMTVTAMQLAGTRPEKGVVVPVSIPDNGSNFHHRQELVYLPPAWFATNPAPRLPTVMMIGAALNTPADWLRAGHAIHIIDDFATAHGGNAPVLVFVDATGGFNNDTECVNGSRGNAADHLTKDVIPYMISNFRVSSDRANWGIAGWSMGGTCAVDLTVMHPDLFTAFVDIAGDAAPNTGTKDQTIDRVVRRQRHRLRRVRTDHRHHQTRPLQDGLWLVRHPRNTASTTPPRNSGRNRCSRRRSP